MFSRRQCRGRAVLLACLVIALAPSCAARSVLAIDYGTESFKAALVQPGVAFDVLLDRDSKRKTASVVSVRGDERHVGSAAVALVRGHSARGQQVDDELIRILQATRYPRDVVQGAKLLLGGDADRIAHHAQLWAHDVNVTDGRSVHIRLAADRLVSAEELVAMQLAAAADAAQRAGGDRAADAVVTVLDLYGSHRRSRLTGAKMPAHFGQVGRRALRDAVELAGLRPLTLVTDGAAGADTSLYGGVRAR